MQKRKRRHFCRHIEGETHVISFADLCLLLGAMFAFGTLILKVIEVTRNK